MLIFISVVLLVSLHYSYFILFFFKFNLICFFIEFISQRNSIDGCTLISTAISIFIGHYFISELRIRTPTI